MRLVTSGVGGDPVMAVACLVFSASCRGGGVVRSMPGRRGRITQARDRGWVKLGSVVPDVGVG